MPTLIGIVLALAVAVFARATKFDRDRAFYPVVLMVIASYYILLAVMADSPGLVTEVLVFAWFAGLAVLSFRTSLWIAVAALALHGIFDFFRDSLLASHGVPLWWPGFCLGYDLAAAAGLAVLLLLGATPAGKDTTG